MSSIFDAFERKEDGKNPTPTSVSVMEKSREEPKSLMSSIFDRFESNPKKDKKEDAESSDPNKVKITKVFDFAGDSVE